MDDNRFDALAKLTGARATRRGLALVALLGLGVAPASSGGAKSNKTKQCKPNQRTCGKRCIPKARCCTTNDCSRGNGTVCRNGQCVCPSGQQRCKGVCRPTTAECCSDADCPGANGFCFADGCGCIGDARLCGNRCILLSECCTDLDCGAVLNQACGPDRACICATGFKRCAGECIANNACCTNGDGVCAAGQICVQNQCVFDAGT